MVRLDVLKIEVSKIAMPFKGASAATYGRTIRFVTKNGEAFDVVCEAGGKSAVEFVAVDNIPPVKHLIEPLPDWLSGKIYKNRRNRSESAA